MGSAAQPRQLKNELFAIGGRNSKDARGNYLASVPKKPSLLMPCPDTDNCRRILNGSAIVRATNEFASGLNLTNAKYEARQDFFARLSHRATIAYFATGI